jgi:hypothetical protein
VEREWRNMKPSLAHLETKNLFSGALRVVAKKSTIKSAPHIGCRVKLYTCKEKRDNMATVATNDLMKGLRGKFGNSLVFRTMRGKTHVSPLVRKPGKQKESVAQRNTRVKFSEASQWAQATLLSPEKKTYYKQCAKMLNLHNAYTAAIADYMRKPKVVKAQHRGTITYLIRKPGFALKQVLVAHNEGMGTPLSNIVTRQHKDLWRVHYTPNSSLSPITLVIVDNAGTKVKFVDVIKTVDLSQLEIGNTCCW